MAFKAEIDKKSIESLKRKYGALTTHVRIAAIESTQTLALRIHEIAVKSIQKQDGIIGKRYNPKRRVTVSKPGDPPNSDTGRLVQSIRFEFREGGLVALVGTDLKYGTWLEFGTKKMAARPWLLPATRKAQRELGRKPYIKGIQAAAKALKQGQR